MYRLLIIFMDFSHVYAWGHFEGERVEKLFPLLKCLRTPKMHRIAGFYIYSLENFFGSYTPDCTSAPPPALGQQFPLVSSAFPLFLLTKRPLSVSPRAVLTEMTMILIFLYFIAVLFLFLLLCRITRWTSTSGRRGETRDFATTLRTRNCPRSASEWTRRRTSGSRTRFSGTRSERSFTRLPSTTGWWESPTTVACGTSASKWSALHV